MTRAPRICRLEGCRRHATPRPPLSVLPLPMRLGSGVRSFGDRGATALMSPGGGIAPIDLGSAFAENAAECSTMASHHSPDTRSDDDPIGPTFTRASNSSCRRRETSANGRATW